MGGGFSPHFPAREGWKEWGATTSPQALCPLTPLGSEEQQPQEATGAGRSELPLVHRESEGISLAMPQCLLWICLAVWEASADLPFIVENDAALMVNW